MTKAQKEAVMAALDTISNDIGTWRSVATTGNLEEVAKHLELAADLLDGEPTNG